MQHGNHVLYVNKGINAEFLTSFVCVLTVYRPAACLTVPGPGLLHALAGMQNANENGW